MNRMLAVLLIVAVSVTAQETKKSEAEAMMDFYIDAAKPVEEHKRLIELTGPWKVTTRLWFDPAAEPQIATGPGNGRAILGGRFVVMDADVKGGMGTESMTIFGFDRRTNDYTMIGLDTLGTYWISAAGKYDDARKGVVLHGSYAQPPTGQEVKYRFLWSQPSKNEHLFTLWFLMGGQDVRVAETRYTRP